MSESGRLQGKRALITGSGTGIGREIALHFAREGADVVLHYAHSAGGAESAVEEIQAMGRPSKPILLPTRSRLFWLKRPWSCSAASTVW